MLFMDLFYLINLQNSLAGFLPLPLETTSQILLSLFYKLGSWQIEIETERMLQSNEDSSVIQCKAGFLLFQQPLCKLMTFEYINTNFSYNIIQIKFISIITVLIFKYMKSRPNTLLELQNCSAVAFTYSIEFRLSSFKQILDLDQIYLVYYNKHNNFVYIFK